MRKTFTEVMKNGKRLNVLLLTALAVVQAFPLARGQMAPVPEAADQAPPGANLSMPAGEVVKLASAGTSEDVILAYVQNAQTPFMLSAENVIYLKDMGVSSQVITAMLNRDKTLHDQGASAYAPTTPTTAPEPPVPQPAAPPPAYVSSPPADVAYFYSDLSPYGTWVQLPTYGWCWQPTVVVANHTWQPYCDAGHWTYTDAGWYWVSDYSWGWAPFHYGRWCLDARCGWVWAPDRVWGPAWVVWRSGGDHCGWAPLPPHSDFDVRMGWRYNGVSVGVGFDFGLGPSSFTFIAMKDFNEHDLGHRRLPTTQVTQVYKQTTVINNYTVVNNRIVNPGIKVDRIATATHTQIHKATIRDLPAGAGAMPQTHGWEKSGLVVYRPQLQAPAKPVNMVAQKVDEHHPVIQHQVQRANFNGSITAPGHVNPPAQGKVMPAPTQTPTTHPSGPASPMAPYRPQPEPQKPSPRPGPQPQPSTSPQAPMQPKGASSAPARPENGLKAAVQPPTSPTTHNGESRGTPSGNAHQNPYSQGYSKGYGDSKKKDS
jgi:hypothetical protein